MAVKRTITHLDPDGIPVSSDWYFALGKSDMLEMDVVHDYEDVPAYLASILKDPKNHSREILKLWKEMLFHSVGQRDGNLLIKDESVVRNFKFSGAYEQFLSELMDEEDAGASFFVSIMPSDVQAKVREETTHVWTKEEMLGMTDEEFEQHIGTDLKNMTKDQQLVAFQRRNAGRSDAA